MVKTIHQESDAKVRGTPGTMYYAHDKKARYQLRSVFLDVFTAFGPDWSKGEGDAMAMQDVHLGE